ncbi:hypothetical protein GGX14DRAFT_656137 [Mycena pura]|uniref:Uncharacterized protein n=1 Tax=Mycena pura TaxID=153505 RepID=A0AAD6Y636_9AGAR|nr:hypothetical protein GGX14DRAFT_656137 [Mycena pura]
MYTEPWRAAEVVLNSYLNINVKLYPAPPVIVKEVNYHSHNARQLRVYLTRSRRYGVVGNTELTRSGTLAPNGLKDPSPLQQSEGMMAAVRSWDTVHQCPGVCAKQMPMPRRSYARMHRHLYQHATRFRHRLCGSEVQDPCKFRPAINATAAHARETGHMRIDMTALRGVNWQKGATATRPCAAVESFVRPSVAAHNAQPSDNAQSRSPPTPEERLPTSKKKTSYQQVTKIHPSSTPPGRASARRCLGPAPRQETARSAGAHEESWSRFPLDVLLFSPFLPTGGAPSAGRIQNLAMPSSFVVTFIGTGLAESFRHSASPILLRRVGMEHGTGAAVVVMC